MPPTPLLRRVVGGFQKLIIPEIVCRGLAREARRRLCGGFGSKPRHKAGATSSIARGVKKR